jgi:hypothetical protein
MAKKKRTSNDLQNTTQKTDDCETRIPLKTGSELRYFGRVKLPAQLVATVDLFLLQIR